ncbi:MAG: hypothetical protein R3A52_00690 [Polyangiales bacterium]
MTTGVCVACTPAEDRCPLDQYCVAATNTCAPGCRDDAACAAVADAGRSLRCERETHRCVECTADDQCPTNTRCEGNVCSGVCGPGRGCPGGQGCCGERCVDTYSNIAHCGACGARCAVAHGVGACQMGRCAVAACTAPFESCDGSDANGCEADLSTSTAHCGACGRACTAGANATATCAMGRCVVACEPGFADCDMNPANGCEVDTRTSADHCGACGSACRSAAHFTATCAMGRCASGCEAGFADCDMNPANGCEVDTRTSGDHCGACGATCRAGANATAACEAGRCARGCDAGYADCDGDVSTGCETRTDTATDCGACGNACPPVANASPTCAMGRCGFACDAGWADCDGDAANGCETDTTSSAEHCGRCGNACASGAACAMGACACPGSPGEVCGGVCRDLSVDRSHCGFCDNACADGESCIAATGSAALACRPACFISVTEVEVPGSGVILGYDPAWARSAAVVGTSGRGAVVLDDASAAVSAAVFNVPSLGDVRAEAARVEAALTTAFGSGVTPVVVGAAFTTHEMNPAVTSTYRVTRATSASALRDATVSPMVGVAAPAGATVGASGEFIVEVTTVRRTMGPAAGRTDVAMTVAPRAAMEDYARPTAIRAADLTNTTALAARGGSIGFGCQEIAATAGAPVVDFLWTVDTSGSMASYQNQVGNAASQFFDRMRLAGLDFRVGVLQAGYGGFNIAVPGFHWIAGDDTGGALQLCQEVTYAACPLPGTDTLRPYNGITGSENPVSAAVIAHNEFRRRASIGEMNPNFRLRAGARFVTVFVTDEPGSNDFNQFFSFAPDPQTGTPFGSVYNASSLGNIVDYFRRNNVITYGIVPVTASRACSAYNVADLDRCVIEGNNGGAIPIGRGTDADVAAALTRLVDTIGGATSPFVLDRTPITSMIRVRVRGEQVPRSRVNGFDYDPAARAVVFYGSRYRPRAGESALVQYRVWQR